MTEGSEKCNVRRTWPTIAGFEEAERDMNQEMQAALEPGKGKEKYSPLEAPERHAALPITWS